MKIILLKMRKKIFISHEKKQQKIKIIINFISNDCDEKKIKKKSLGYIRYACIKNYRYVRFFYHLEDFLRNEKKTKGKGNGEEEEMLGISNVR